MDGDHWIVNSQEKLSHFLRHAQEEFKKHRFLRIKVQHGSPRTRSQEALWGIWARECIAPFAKVSEEGARLAMYHMFLGYEDVKVSKKLTIPGQLKRFPEDAGEAYRFMSRVQAFWFDRGLVLESSGDFAKHQIEEVA